MNTYVKAGIVAIIGVLIFASGAWLLFQADELGTVNFPVSSMFPNGSRMDLYSKEYRDVAHVLIWSGGAMLVLAAAGWLFGQTPPGRCQTDRPTNASHDKIS